MSEVWWSNEAYPDMRQTFGYQVTGVCITKVMCCGRHLAVSLNIGHVPDNSYASENA